MLTSVEAKFGKNMALLAAISLVVSIAINVIIGDTDTSQPNLLLASVDFVGNFALIIVITYSMKLFNLDEEPFIKAIGSIAVIGVTIAMLTDLSPSLTSGGFGPVGFTPTQVSEIKNAVESGAWIIMPLFVLLISLKYRGNMLPSWGGLGGIVAGALIVLLHILALTGLATGLDNVLWPVWLIAGLIGFPLWSLGMSQAFGSKIS